MTLEAVEFSGGKKVDPRGKWVGGGQIAVFTRLIKVS